MSAGYRHIYSLVPAQGNCTSSLINSMSSKRQIQLCGKSTDGPSCDSVKIPTPKSLYFQYQYVLGRVRGYQYGSPDAFYASTNTHRTIDGPYVDGVSITYGEHERKHIYTLASAWRRYGTDTQGTCPETGYGYPPPTFVGTNYICSAGNTDYNEFRRVVYTRNPLWSRNYYYRGDQDDYFYFSVKLPKPTNEDIELRLCTDQPLLDENILLDVFDLYIKE